MKDKINSPLPPPHEQHHHIHHTVVQGNTHKTHFRMIINYHSAYSYDVSTVRKSLHISLQEIKTFDSFPNNKIIA
jgi:hypothetical protein